MADYRDPTRSIEASEERQKEHDRRTAEEKADLAASVDAVSTNPLVALGRDGWTFISLVLTGLLMIGAVVVFRLC